MVEDGVRYNCCEQYMMAQKALLFNDHKTYDMIMRDGNPANMKKYGRMVRNFNDAVWNENKFDIVKRGNYLKFSQNSELKEMLLDTDDNTLGEDAKVIILATGIDNRFLPDDKHDDSDEEYYNQIIAKLYREPLLSQSAAAKKKAEKEPKEAD